MSDTLQKRIKIVVKEVEDEENQKRSVEISKGELVQKNEYVIE